VPPPRSHRGWRWQRGGDGGAGSLSHPSPTMSAMKHVDDLLEGIYQRLCIRPQDSQNAIL